LSLLAVLLFGLIIAPNLADASRRKRNCVEILGNNSYSCQFRFKEGGSVENLSLQFFPAPAGDGLVVSFDFGPQSPCQCGALGSFKEPQFGASNEFFCGVDTGSGGEALLTGRAEFFSIRDGQFFAFNGNFSRVYRCIKSVPE
jgi:hypothetical protein